MKYEALVNFKAGKKGVLKVGQQIEMSKEEAAGYLAAKVIALVDDVVGYVLEESNPSKPEPENISQEPEEIKLETKVPVIRKKPKKAKG